jgi:uncharacterized protein (DUF2267 family)
MGKISEKLEKAASEILHKKETTSSAETSQDEPSEAKSDEPDFLDRISESLENFVEDVVDTAKAVAEVVEDKIEDAIESIKKDSKADSEEE